MTKIITQANLPNVKLNVDSHNHSLSAFSAQVGIGYSSEIVGADKAQTVCGLSTSSIGKWLSNSIKLTNGTIGSSSPKTSTLGSGQALDITPAYYSCHMWLRTS